MKILNVLVWIPAVLVVVLGVLAQWEGTQPQRGLASETLRADQAPIGEIGQNSKVPPEDIQKLQTADHIASAGKPIVDYAALAALDARDHPSVTVSLESIVVAAATGRVRVLGGSLSEGEMHAVLTEAGWPVELHDQALAVSWCESKWSPNAVGDGGASVGIFQLWNGWFHEGEEPFDALTNAKVALRVREVRGRWGGGGGWSCADHLGIP